MCSKEIGLGTHNFITILDSIINMISGTYNDQIMRIQFSFDNEFNIRMSSTYHKDNEYMHDF